jgi:hypothetical protein
MTRYQPGSVWRPRGLSSGRAVLQMLDHAYAARYAPERTLAALLQVAARAQMLTGVRGDAAEVARSLLDRVGRTP